MERYVVGFKRPRAAKSTSGVPGAAYQGLTKTRTTMPIISRVGTSLAMR